MSASQEDGECHRSAAERPKSNLDFHELVIQSIEMTIREVLGEEPLQAFFTSLQQISGIRREEVPERLEEIDDALLKIFGRGSGVITRMIAHNLYDRVGVEYHPKSNYGLKMYVEECRQQYERRRVPAPETSRSQLSESSRTTGEISTRYLGRK